MQLNVQKTEFIWCAPARRRHHIPNGDVQVGHGPVHPVQSARDLGVYVDGGITIRTHILHSSNEPGELSQWLCHDDSTINIVVVIIIIIIRAFFSVQFYTKVQF